MIIAVGMMNPPWLLYSSAAPCAIWTWIRRVAARQPADDSRRQDDVSVMRRSLLSVVALRDAADVCISRTREDVGEVLQFWLIVAV